MKVAVAHDVLKRLCGDFGERAGIVAQGDGLGGEKGVAWA